MDENYFPGTFHLNNSSENEDKVNRIHFKEGGKEYIGIFTKETSEIRTTSMINVYQTRLKIKIQE